MNMARRRKCSLEHCNIILFIDDTGPSFHSRIGPKGRNTHAELVLASPWNLLLKYRFVQEIELLKKLRSPLWNGKTGEI